MTKTMLAYGAAAILMLGGPLVASADSTCCDNHSRCDGVACCQHKNDPQAEAVLMPEPAEQATLARQTAVVRFDRPVRVTDHILFGKYIIEHDNDRQARGEPCTHIYAADNPRQPVVTFHCTHLDRPRVERDSVKLRSLGEINRASVMTEFQFKGDTAAHGVPRIR